MPSPKSFFYLNKLALIVLIQEGKKAGRKERWGGKGGRKKGERVGKGGREKERKNSLMAL